jgi:hypothetical protein
MLLIKYLTHFDFLILMGIKIEDKKKIPLGTRSFLSLVVHFKEFGPKLYIKTYVLIFCIFLCFKIFMHNYTPM